ncbi:hypothetical protein IWQ60_002705 [Tieghemiomyces parasiticus]|uniref:Uncharacterized protein n=1 Tax=Tieghemiomyces parasiticus TaxID=78921 RepID=A0A9W8E0Q9_9FUNG|nr:hypothetical protein IWQ60_002705 [Tieghemiomyces parasiticus]
MAHQSASFAPATQNWTPPAPATTTLSTLEVLYRKFETGLKRTQYRRSLRRLRPLPARPTAAPTQPTGDTAQTRRSSLSIFTGHPTGPEVSSVKTRVTSQSTLVSSFNPTTPEFKAPVTDQWVPHGQITPVSAYAPTLESYGDSYGPLVDPCARWYPPTSTGPFTHGGWSAGTATSSANDDEEDDQLFSRVPIDPYPTPVDLGHQKSFLHLALQKSVSAPTPADFFSTECDGFCTPRNDYPLSSFLCPEQYSESAVPPVAMTPAPHGFDTTCPPSPAIMEDEQLRDEIRRYNHHSNQNMVIRLYGYNPEHVPEPASDLSQDRDLLKSIF